jgi:hypothetical protein
MLPLQAFLPVTVMDSVLRGLEHDLEVFAKVNLFWAFDEYTTDTDVSS